MKTHFVKGNEKPGTKSLILFLCGWGCDQNSYAPISNSTSDILFVYDYSELSLEFDFGQYEKIDLVCFSFGVFMASVLQDRLPKCNKKIAVNGTLKTVSDDFGIPEKAFTLMKDHMTEASIPKFRRKLFTEEAELKKFNKNLPKRTFENSMAELKILHEIYKNHGNADFGFDKVIISSQDRIMPAKNQLKYWAEAKNHQNIIEIDAGHFVFYNFETIDDIISL